MPCWALGDDEFPDGQGIRNFQRMVVGGRERGRSIGLHLAVVKATTDSFQIPHNAKMGRFNF